MVRRIDNHFVKPEAVDSPPQMLQVARRLHFARKRRKLVRNHPHRPRLPRHPRCTHHLRRRLVLIPRTEWTRLNKSRHGLHRPMCRQLLRPLSPLRSNNYPFLSKEVLTQLRHMNPSNFPYRQSGRILEPFLSQELCHSDRRDESAPFELCHSDRRKEPAVSRDYTSLSQPAMPPQRPPTLVPRPPASPVIEFQVSYESQNSCRYPRCHRRRRTKIHPDA